MSQLLDLYLRLASSILICIFLGGPGLEMNNLEGTEGALLLTST
jgi:hypothetical protein